MWQSIKQSDGYNKSKKNKIKIINLKYVFFELTKFVNKLFNST